MGVAAWWGVRGGGGPSASARAESTFPAELETWVGQELEYGVSCPLIADFAVGELSLQRIRNSSTYLAVLNARLQGAVGLLTLQRTDLFASLMEWSPELKRFLPVWHGDQVARKGSWRRKVLVFHRERGEYQEHKIKPEGARQKRYRTQGRLLDDPLTAFFNWRAGAFGALGSGRSYLIDNLARKEPMVLRFDLASDEEARNERAAFPPGDARAFLLKAHLEQELQESVRGNVEAWLDREWVPVFGRATQVRWVGEVTASLTGRRRLPQPERSQAPAPPLQPEIWRL